MGTLNGITVLRREASLLPPFVSPRPYARWATGLMLVTMGFAWIAVGVELAQLRLLLLASSGTPVSLPARAAQTWTNDALLWTQVALLVATGLAFALWILQARVNLRSFGVRRLAYSRHWAWASFLVPVVNFFRPYQVVREIWKASDPTNLDAFNWRSIQPPPLLRLWWASLVGWWLLELLTVLMSLGAGLHLAKLQLSTSISLVADVAAAAAACLACFLVSRISDNQEAKWALQRIAETDPARS